AALLHDLSIPVEADERGGPEVDALVRRRHLAALRCAHRAGVRAAETHLKCSAAVVLLDDGEDVDAEVRETPEEDLIVLTQCIAPQRLGVEGVVRDGIGRVQTDRRLRVALAESLTELTCNVLNFS